MNFDRVVNIRDYRVRVPPNWSSDRGKHVIQFRHVNEIAADDPAWLRFTDLGDDFFRPAFDKRNPLNLPGPFYGAETDTCATGPDEAPNNVLMDRYGQEFVCKQPANEEELRDIISAARCECFCGYGGYGADGNDHWTLALIRDWWKSRHDLLAHASDVWGAPESILAWQRFLSGEGVDYLRAYAFFVEKGRVPESREALPELD
jgi:hypothetical protein